MDFGKSIFESGDTFHETSTAHCLDLAEYP